MAVKTVPVQNASGQAVCVRVIQADASLVQPLVIIRARCGNEAGSPPSDFAELDRLLLPAPNGSGRSGNRIVAIAAIPGATSYQVEVTGADNPGLELQVGEWFVRIQPVTWVFTTNAPPASGQPITLVWVNSQTGDDLTAQRGRIDLPAATLLRAIEIAQPGDCIKVTPGTYPGFTFDASNALLQKPGLTFEADGQGAQGDANVIVQGVGPGSVGLNLVAGSPAGASAFTGVTFSGMLFRGPAAGVRVQNQQGNANNYLENGLVFNNCAIESDAGFALDAKQIGRLVMRGCRMNQQSRVEECGGGFIENTQGNGFIHSYDYTEQTPSTGQTPLDIRSSNLGDIVSLNQAQQTIDEASEAPVVDCTGWDAGPGDEQPSLQGHGRLGAVSLFLPEYTTGQAVVDLDGAQMASLLTDSLDPGNGNLYTIQARGATFDGPVQAGHRCNLDLSGAAYDQAFLASAGSIPGTIRTDRRVLAPVPDAAGPVTVPISPPFPDANYSVDVERDTDGNLPAITNKTAAGFDFASAAPAGNIVFTLVHR